MPEGTTVHFRDAEVRVGFRCEGCGADLEVEAPVRIVDDKVSRRRVCACGEAYAVTVRAAVEVRHRPAEIYPGETT